MLDVADGSVNSFFIRGEWSEFADDLAELEDRQAIHRTQNSFNKTPGRGQFQRQVFTRAQASINAENNGQRKFRLFVEDRNLLRVPIFFEHKVFLLEASDRRSAVISHGHKDVYQPDIDTDGGIVLG